MCARARVRAHVAKGVTVYADGSPKDTHMCSSAIELSLHLGISMSNAHMHRPFPRCMYTHIRLYASIVRARVLAWMCVCMAARCMRANYEDLSTFWRKVLYGGVKM